MAELARWEASCAPADPRSVAVLVEQTLELFGLPDNWDQVADFYLEAFEDVPLDLVKRALKDVRMGCKFFPKPTELRDPIRQDLARRRIQISRLNAMLKFGLRPA